MPIALLASMFDATAVCEPKLKFAADCTEQLAATTNDIGIEPLAVAAFVEVDAAIDIINTLALAQQDNFRFIIRPVFFR